jgi:hypothetical protein
MKTIIVCCLFFKKSKSALEFDDLRLTFLTRIDDVVVLYLQYLFGVGSTIVLKLVSLVSSLIISPLSIFYFKETQQRAFSTPAGSKCPFW